MHPKNFSDYITEVYEMQNGVRASEVAHVRRYGDYFYIAWRRGFKVFVCRSIPSVIAIPMIMAWKEEIKNRKDPESRVEDWECDNEHGVFDFSIYTALLKGRNNG